jgi:L-amino acid N-acyltransferase YncA
MRMSSAKDMLGRESPRMSSPAATEPCIIRHAHAGDVPAMLAIYSPIVRDTTISFEYEPPTIAELEERLHAIQRHYPWLVAERAGEIAGYAYASFFRSRPAYQWATEVTVYVHPDHHRRGVAQALYRQLLDRLRAQGFRTAVAVITLPNAGSVGLHERMGFEPMGVLQRAGFKHGQWCDIGWWQLDLGGDRAPAPPRPPAMDRG